MKERNYKMSIIDQFIYAVSKPKEYPKLIQQKMGRVLNFAFVISVLMTIISFVIPLVGYQLSLSGLHDFFKEGIPQFQIQDSELQMDGTLEMSVFGIDIQVDPTVEKYTINDLDDSVFAQILVSKTNAVVYNTMFVNEISFDSIKGITIDNNFLVEMVPVIYGMEVIAVFMMIISQFIAYLMGAAGYAFVALSFLSLKPNMTSTIAIVDMFKIGVYCKALMSFLTAINESLGYVVGIYYWQTAVCLVSFVYLAKGVTAYVAKKNTPSEKMS